MRVKCPYRRQSYKSYTDSHIMSPPHQKFVHFRQKVPKTFFSETRLTIRAYNHARTKGQATRTASHCSETLGFHTLFQNGASALS
jgi:hypothetical protein